MPIKTKVKSEQNHNIQEIRVLKSLNLFCLKVFVKLRMTTIKSFIALALTCSIAFFSSCQSNNKEEAKSAAILDTVSLSNKSYALAYQDGDKIVATSIDTMKQISFGGATDPAISPDGNKLAYSVNDSLGHKSIWIADLENKSQSQLMVSHSNYFQAMWSPDGNLVAFSIFNPKNLWKVGIVRLDGSGYVMLDSASATNIYSPTWKNEKEIIAHDLTQLYTFDRTGKLTGKLMLADLLGKEFTITSSNRFFYTQDGSKIIFNTGKVNKENLQNTSVYVLDLASKKINQISPPEINAPYLFVTADDRIFYSGTEKSFNQSKIYVTDLSGRVKKVVDKGINPTATLK